MEQKITDAVIAELLPLLDEQGFTAKDDCYSDGKTAVKINYNDQQNLFELLCADVTDGSVGEFSVASSYLFDNSSTVADASAVGIDFVDTLRTRLGINTRKTRSRDAVMPTKGTGDTPGMGDLCQKLLAIFPKYKDDYKEHMEKYGELLYVEFLLTTVADGMHELLASGNDKKIKKTFDSLNDLYVKGDRTVGDAIVVVVIGGAIKGDSALRDKAISCLEDFPYLKTAVRSICEITPKDKRLKELYGI